jgi:AcrR family transcriptional regulator
VSSRSQASRAKRRGTRLQRQLKSPTEFLRPTPLDALRLARRKFLAAERVNMSALANQLGVNRATLYRWVGSREQLLVEVVWSLGAQTLANVDRAVRAKGAERKGAERIVCVVTRFLEEVISNQGLGRWVAEEGELAIRLLTGEDTEFQQRLVAAIEELLREESDAGRLDLPVSLHEAAYAIVRLIESCTYLDFVTGEQPDARWAESILRLLLR